MKKYIKALIVIMLCSITICIAQDKQAPKKHVSTVTLQFQSDPGSDSLTVYLSDAKNFINPFSEQRIPIMGKTAIFKLSQDHLEFIAFELPDHALFRKSGYTSLRGYFIEPGDRLKFDIGQDYDHGILNVSFSGRGSEKYNFLKSYLHEVHKKVKSLKYGAPLASRFENAIQRNKVCIDVLQKFKTKISQQVYSQILASTICDNFDGPTYSYEAGSDGAAVQKALFAKYILPVKQSLADANMLFDQGVLAIMNRIARMEYFIDRNEPYQFDYFRDKTVDFLKLLEQKYPSPRLNQPLIAYNIQMAMFREDISGDMHRYLQAFIKRDGLNKEIRDQVRLLLAQYDNDLAPGKKAYAFMLPDTTGKLVKQDDFKGKVVVLDFFFNGCVGCYQIAPLLDSLEKVYSNKNVSFVSISIDKDKMLWKSGIGKFSSKYSEQLYTNGLGVNHSLIRYYRIASYPTLMIIDKLGNILSSRAPDPRSATGLKSFTQIIDKALTN